MKVNIAGKGLIPIVNMPGPIHGIELTKQQIKGLLNYRDIRVFGANGFGLITSRNVNQIPDTIKLDEIVSAATDNVNEEKVVALVNTNSTNFKNETNEKSSETNTVEIDVNDDEPFDVISDDIIEDIMYVNESKASTEDDAIDNKSIVGSTETIPSENKSKYNKKNKKKNRYSGQ